MNKRATIIPDLTDEEEARIQAGIAVDPDNPEWTGEDFKNARPLVEVSPELADSIEREGVIVLGDPKLNQLVAVERRIVDKFKEQGEDWQVRINAVLRKAVGL
jgi:uncharacterized protein (DUF4415 family)